MTTQFKYAELGLKHLEKILQVNEPVMNRLVERLVHDVEEGKSLLIFGSGHSAIFPLELYHRAGGASFVIPLVGEYLMPTAGPSVIRVLERTPGVSVPLLLRAEPKPGEMVWIASQSGINAASVDMAIKAKEMGLFTVAFTSVVHSQCVSSRHPSGKRLFEICDLVVDLGGRVGDALVPLQDDLFAGPVSTLGSVFLGHSIVVEAIRKLETKGNRCVYTSVNTPTGEARNRAIEALAAKRDPLLR